MTSGILFYSVAILTSASAAAATQDAPDPAPALAADFTTSSAQTVVPPADVPPADAPPADQPEADAEEAGGLEDIVVTATRREERLQDVPISVSVVTGNAIGVAGVTSTRELTRVAPGYVGARNMGAFQPVIRGIGSAGVSIGDESNVAMYIDGVYYPDSGANWLELVEVDRVEVLKGPQGTIFGRNATGGLVNVITPDPSFVTRGHIGGSFGRMRNNSNEIELRGYATTGLTDKVAVDFAGLYRNTEGYIKDLVRGGEFGDQRVVHLRSKLLFQPSDRATFILSGEFFDQDGQVNAPQPFEGNTMGRNFPGAILADDPWEAALDIIPLLDVRRFNLALRTRFEFDAFNIETTTGFQNWLHLRQNTDADATNINLGSLPAEYSSKSISQEVRFLSTDDGPLQWLAGAYFFDHNGVLDLSLIGGATPAGLVKTDLGPRTWTRAYAGFAEGTYQFVDRLFLTAGARYSWEERKFSQNLNGNDLFGVAKKSFDSIDYRVALRYNFAPDANVYASYGTAFKSGVFNAAGLSPVAVEPESIAAMEIGIKADPLRWLRTNFAAYRYKYDELQVTAKAPTGPGYVLQNAATAVVYGAEFEALAALTDDFNLRASVAYNHAEYDEFPGAQSFIPLPTGGNEVVSLDASGKTLTRAPRWAFTLGGSWSQELGGGQLTLAGNLFHSSKVYYDFQNTFAQPAYTLASGQATWSTPDDLWSFTLAVDNITDEAVVQQIRPGAPSADVFYEQPRKVSLGVQRRF